MSSREENPAAFYLAEARMEAIAEPQAAERASLLAGCIEEGDVAVSGVHVLSAYHAMGEETGTDPAVYWPLARKQQLARQLIAAFSAHRDFDTAYNIADDLNRTTSFYGTTAKTDLLAQGYTGPDGQLLDLFDTEYLFRITDEEDASATHDLELFLVGLAGFGIDLSIPGTKYHDLLEQLRTFDVTGERQEKLASKLAVAYYAGDHPELAATFMKNVKQHTTRGKMLLEMSEHTDDLDELSALSDEIVEQAIYAGSCWRTCGGKYCSPERDQQELALSVASLRAKIGNIEHARYLLETFDNGFHFPRQRLAAHLELYKAEGLEKDRTAVLKLLNDVGYMPRPQIVDFIRTVAQADIQHGQTLPSLDAEGETTPRLVWEIQDALSRKNAYEARHEGAEDPVFDAMFGPYAEWHQEVYEKERRQKRSAAFSTLAVVLAEQGSHESARHMLEQIEIRTDKVRTKMALARVYGAPELQPAA